MMKKSFIKYVVVVSIVLIPLCSLAHFRPAQVDICFTPKSYCRGMILSKIYDAKQSIYVQSYSFTSYKIANALIYKFKHGVDVKVIMDKSQFQCGQYSQRARLIRAGIPVWEDYKLNIAHNKIMIIDGRLVQTGSYNYTVSAQKYNAENVLMIKSVPIATDYLENWRLRAGQSRRVEDAGYCVPPNVGEKKYK